MLTLLDIFKESNSGNVTTLHCLYYFSMKLTCAADFVHATFVRKMDKVWCFIYFAFLTLPTRRFDSISLNFVCHQENSMSLVSFCWITWFSYLKLLCFSFKPLKKRIQIDMQSRSSTPWMIHPILKCSTFSQTWTLILEHQVSKTFLTLTI